LLTVDKSIEHQQNLSRFDLGIVLLEVSNNIYEGLAPFMERADAEIRRVRPGTVTRVERQSRKK